MTTGRAWIMRVEYDRRDWRIGLAWEEAADGLHIYVCAVVRVHFIRTKLHDIAPGAHKHTLPPPVAPPKPVQGSAVNFHRFR